MNVFLLEPTHGHSTSNNLFLPSKLQRHIEYRSMSLKNIYELEILSIASSKLKNVKTTKMLFFTLKISLTSEVSVVPNPISIELLVIALFLIELIQVLFVAETTS